MIMVKISKAFYILCVVLWKAQGHFSLLSDHGISTSARITCEGKHIERLGEKYTIKASLFHQLATFFSDVSDKDEPSFLFFQISHEGRHEFYR